MPSYIRTRGARAAVNMIERLKALGIHAAVGEPRKGEMMVVVTDPEQAARVPAELDGYRLKVSQEYPG